jgi:hypothetical protein
VGKEKDGEGKEEWGRVLLFVAVVAAVAAVAAAAAAAVVAVVAVADVVVGDAVAG